MFFLFSCLTKKKDSNLQVQLYAKHLRVLGLQVGNTVLQLFGNIFVIKKKSVFTNNCVLSQK